MEAQRTSITLRSSSPSRPCPPFYDELPRWRPPERELDWDSTQRSSTVHAVIAALYDAPLPPAAGLRVHLHPVRLRPGGDDPGRTWSSTCGGCGATTPCTRATRGRSARRWPSSARCSRPGVAIFSFVGVYDGELFWDHMVQHLLLIMVAAPLFAIASPLDLAWRATTGTAHIVVTETAALAGSPSSSATPSWPSCSTPC